MAQQQTVTVLTAVVSDEEKSIYIRARTEDGKNVSFPVPAEFWGRIPPDKNPTQELQVVANLLNGYMKGDDGEWVPKPKFEPFKITIKAE